MERKITITFGWWQDGSDEEIDKGHAEALEETAWERIGEMMKEGFTSGELNDNIHMHNTDPEDGIAYRGWWEIKKEET